MYIHLGGDEMVPIQDLIVIMNAGVMRKSSVNSTFLKTATEKGCVQLAGEESAKSYVVTTNRVIVSPISTSTLRKRAINRYFDMA